MSYRRRDGFYHIDFRWRERRYRVSTGVPDGAANEQFIKDWDATIRREIGLGTFRLENHFPKLAESLPAAGTFKDKAEAWLKAHESTWAEWTYRKFKNNLESRVFTKSFARLPYAQIKPADLRLLQSEIIQEGMVGGKGKLSNRSVNKIMQPVKECLVELFEDGEILANPVPKNKFKLKEKRVAEIDPFTEKELAVLYKKTRELRPHYAPYIRHLFEAGFRLEEQNGLMWEQVDLATDEIAIRAARVLGKQKDPKTEHASRDVDITAGMRACLLEQKAKSYLHYAHVWVTETGRPLDVSNFRATVWAPLIKAAGLRYRWPNQARHSFATKNIVAGRDPIWIANQMGTSLEMLFTTYTTQFRKLRSGQAGKGKKIVRMSR
jgi:integrase